MSNLNKINQDDINKILEISYKRMQSQNSIGRLEIQIMNLTRTKEQIYNELKEIIKEEQKLDQDLAKKYGNITINTDDWTYTIKEENKE